jgi:hypothetical protein
VKDSANAIDIFAVTTRMLTPTSSVIVTDCVVLNVKPWDTAEEYVLVACDWVLSSDAMSWRFGLNTTTESI